MPDPKLGAGFFTPHDEAAAIVAGKPVLTRQVFDKLVPELRARAMVVTGVEGANTVQRIKDEIADYTRGQTDGGQARTWDDAKAAIAQTLEDEAFSPQAAERRATLLIRTHGFQAYQAANYRVAMEDDDTTHLQYLATEDSRVRDSHLALNGLIMPKGDPFWDKAETAFLSALILYLFHEAPESERNFGTLMHMVINAEAREEDESYRSPVDLLFDDLERVDEDHIAVKNWKVFPPKCLACCMAMLAWLIRALISRALSGIRLIPREALITSSWPPTSIGVRSLASRRLAMRARLERLP